MRFGLAMQALAGDGVRVGDSLAGPLLLHPSPSKGEGRVRVRPARQIRNARWRSQRGESSCHTQRVVCVGGVFGHPPVPGWRHVSRSSHLGQETLTRPCGPTSPWEPAGVLVRRHSRGRLCYMAAPRAGDIGVPRHGCKRCGRGTREPGDPKIRRLQTCATKRVPSCEKRSPAFPRGVENVPQRSATFRFVPFRSRRATGWKVPDRSGNVPERRRKRSPAFRFVPILSAVFRTFPFLSEAKPGGNGDNDMADNWLRRSCRATGGDQGCFAAVHSPARRTIAFFPGPATLWHPHNKGILR
jgi:hypothetical protein